MRIIKREEGMTWAQKITRVYTEKVTEFVKDAEDTFSQAPPIAYRWPWELVAVRRRWSCTCWAAASARPCSARRGGWASRCVAAGAELGGAMWRSALRTARYDVVVVGAGAGGCAVAGRLAQAGAQVLLLEAGPVGPEAASFPVACGQLQGTEVDWQRRCAGHGLGRGLKDGMVNLPSGKMLGGSTSINYMAYVRGNPKNYDSWAAKGATGWSWKEAGKA